MIPETPLLNTAGDALYPRDIPSRLREFTFFTVAPPDNRYAGKVNQEPQQVVGVGLVPPGGLRCMYVGVRGVGAAYQLQVSPEGMAFLRGPWDMMDFSPLLAAGSL